VTVEEDLSAMMADASLTVPVVYGAVTARGFFDWEDVFVQDTVGGQVLTNQQVLTVKTGAIPGLADDTNITIDGTVYRIRTTQKVGDGKLTKVAVA